MAIICLFAGFTAILAASLALVMVHELGHLLLARILGMPCRRIKVGPFQLLRDAARWRLALDTDWDYGLVDCVTDANLISRVKLTLFLLAGSAANMALAAILIIFIFLQSMRFQQADWIGCLFGFAVLSAVMGLGNLLPFRFRGHNSDGLQLWRLCRSEATFAKFRARCTNYQNELPRFEAMKSTYEDFAAGRRPREWDSERVAIACFMHDCSRAEVNALYYAFLWALDCQNPAATEFLDRAVDLRHLEPLFGNALFLREGLLNGFRCQRCSCCKGLARAGWTGAGREIRILALHRCHPFYRIKRRRGGMCDATCKEPAFSE